MRPLIVYSQLNAFFPVKVETGVLDSRPKLLRFHLPLNTKSRSMVKAEKGLSYTMGTCHGTRQSEHSAIFSHLWGTDMSHRFK
jgi:hypothetical protein